MSGGISAILLAAGESRRMGQPKLLLPWGRTTVLGTVLAAFAEGLAGGGIVVVTGGARDEVETLVKEITGPAPVRTVYNPDYVEGGMLSSLQAGLRSLGEEVNAALVGLGDQPQVRPDILRILCKEYGRTAAPLIIPSFKGRRGHPWLVRRSLWEEILALPRSATPRDFLNAHKAEASYIEADETVLQDLDTPEDYRRMRP